MVGSRLCALLLNGIRFDGCVFLGITAILTQKEQEMKSTSSKYYFGKLTAMGRFYVVRCWDGDNSNCRLCRAYVP